MPCYADTIVRIKHVRRNKKEDSRTFSLWAIGTYPLGIEELEMEMTLPMPVNPDDRDPDSQAMFKRDEYYSVGGKIVPGTYAGNKRIKMLVTNSTNISIDGKASSKCPTKVSLAGIPQNMPLDIRHTENSVIDLLVSDYLLHQQYNFIVKVVFPHVNQYKHFKTSVRPHESIIFAIGQLEIIDNEFYVYARDITYIDTTLSTKKRDYEPNNNEVTLITTNSTRSKLLYAHNNTAKNSGVKYSDDTPEKNISSTSTGSEYFESMYQDDLSDDDDLPQDV